MKGVFASFVTVAASLVAANPAPNKVEARATSSAASSSSLPTVTTKGNAFFAGNNRFYIRGVDYQPGGSSDAADPLSNQAGCDRDIEYFKQLDINTVRVYTVDNTADHDYCMTALANAGIYVALDVNTPKYSLNRENEKTTQASYNAVYLQSLFATMDAFAKYTNTLLFFSGNEVVNADNNTFTAPYIKAVTRDMKEYRQSRGMREIPIGYSAADVSSNRWDMASYMNCGTDDQRSDFFAFNDYSWCDPSSYTQSGWSANVQNFSAYSIPIFLSEYGCITHTRTFEEVGALYNTEMTGVYSGGLVYEYAEEDNGYGLVKISGSTVTPKDDFGAFSSQLAKNPAPTGDGGYKSNGDASVCPGSSGTWQVTDFKGSDLPAIPSGAVKYFKSGAGAGPGLSGSGSQNAGGESVGTASAGSGSGTAYVTGASSTSSSSASGSKGAGAVVVPPMGYSGVITMGIFVVSALFGAALL